MMRDRQVELETKIAFLEQHINELSDVVYAQQKTIDLLNGAFNNLKDRLNISTNDAAPIDEKPPHY
ncbi:SlyX family protein [Pseudomonadales bacterium]|nr:SlyX family protein [Pseudomonadales bacterium]MDA8965217.1 SlyX family protein [Pseudomonadales bacterium]MDB4451070.1 SlyX family protein [Pseudomonadales bacterium]MDB4528962.1 SlyX family protein [Pseudomonadales bacterium]MDB4542344.1 SlyX family protein [Pseudomonadales bacterium]